MADSLAEQRRAALLEAEERLALERKLRHSEQFAVVGRLAAGVAHEMGAPLQVIDGRAKQLLHHLDASTGTRQRNLTIIRNQAERIARIVRQLLNLSRPHKLHFRKIGLKALVEEAAELIETQAESAGVDIEVHCDDDAAIEADPELIQQVLLNIFRNGIQAMPQGGRLRVECLKDAAESGGRSFAAVRVSDTGAGIALESLPNIFDPFFTTKEVGHGTGLGLPISSRIVEEHDGWIEAANGVEHGAVFSVYLPQLGPAEKGAEAKSAEDTERVAA
jgi:signal transduction histidine kinase